MAKPADRARVVMTFLVWAAVTAATAWVVFARLDLKPRVDENFLFSPKDPELEADQEINCQRFGIAVILGTLIVPAAALFVLPWIATAGSGEKDGA